MLGYLIQVTAVETLECKDMTHLVGADGLHNVEQVIFNMNLLQNQNKPSTQKQNKIYDT